MIVQIDKYVTVKLEDRGQWGWSLMEGWINKDGDWKPNFCTRKVGKEQIEKTMPVSVKLGDKAKAIEVLTAALKELTGQDYGPSDAPAADDVPF